MIDRHLQTLIGLEPLKTWSLIVTLFGDMQTARISGTQLRDFLGQIGIKPEAIRVALHRLRSDGWILSEKTGREAIYWLSDKGAQETEAARPQIYGTRPARSWQMLILGRDPAPKGAISLISNVVLVARDVRRDTDALRVQPMDPGLPDWACEVLLPPPLATIARALLGVVSSPTSNQQDPLLRVLILHHWRRLALRSGTWALIDVAPQAEVARAQGLITAYLATGPRLALT